MQKLDEQPQQIRRLTEKQSTQLEEIERRQYQMEKHVNSLMEEQKSMQQEMMLKHKQDFEADMLGQSFGSYSGPVDVLPEEDLQVRVRQSRPATLRQALKVSLGLESLCLASKQRLHAAM